MGDVLQVPVDAVEEGWDGSGLNVDGAGAAGDAESIGLAGAEREVKLWGEVGHEAPQDGLCGGDGRRRRLGRGLGASEYAGESEQEAGAAERTKRKHSNTIAPSAEQVR